MEKEEHCTIYLGYKLYSGVDAILPVFLPPFVFFPIHHDYIFPPSAIPPLTYTTLFALYIYP